jgi:hypothetical protein
MGGLKLQKQKKDQAKTLQAAPARPMLVEASRGEWASGS